MNIIVEGNGLIEIIPDVIDISLTFEFLEKEYNQSLFKGTESIKTFVNNVLPELNLNGEDFITSNFNIEHETHRDYKTDKIVDLGYKYHQEAKIRLTYTNENIKIFMNEVSKISDAPEYNITFDIQNKEEASIKCLKDAYEKAENKAKAIAVASGKELLECRKIDFKPIEGISLYYNNASHIHEKNNDIDIPAFFRKKEKTNEFSFEKFTASFCPNKIKICQTIYCQWITK